ncbi:uncharacterized protein BDR25DRAFT_342812 [Lindgomyces ingoldianus]|uniref:Uncharacterized protein n=1 Tax=Lindgomyces ingoldianus TaxID=673940 RepID=A0ACB6QWT2_9PLEO|nr:uncharacterized protein BDR25DRAFT_342812 [Lindgomyces ingoldianus]KAF2471038.1 hypothetical protein BDR25DRAFT_342812 [Lindgomyces ingoldianus]
MVATVLPPAGIALHGAPDSDIGSRDARHAPIQAMQLEMTQDMVSELLDSVRSGKAPQLFFGRTPLRCTSDIVVLLEEGTLADGPPQQLKYGDNKTHVLQTTPESHRYELYETSSAGGDDDLTFTGLINHSLAVQKAEAVTAGVDTALEQLKNSMAAISEFKEANKTIVGNAGTPIGTPHHRRFPSKSLKPSHLAPHAGSPLLSVPSSPGLSKKPRLDQPPTSQPDSNQQAILRALRVPVIHLLAKRPWTEKGLSEECRSSLTNMRALLPKIGKHGDGPEKWVLSDKAYRELDPWTFPWKDLDDRVQAIKNAIRAFDRLRLPKDDPLWQILLPQEERGQGKCLSRLNVQAPAQKAATPLHKISKLTEKKITTSKKTEEKEVKDGKKVKEMKEPKEPKQPKEPRQPKEPKQPKPKKPVRDEAKVAKAVGTPIVKPTTAKNNSQTDPAKANKKVVDGSTPRVKPKASGRDAYPKERVPRQSRPAVPVNTKPKNPSPLSASPPVNASDFEDSHPVHKALSAAPSPAKTSGSSDRPLKRKANDVDGDSHSHKLSAKQPRVDRSTPNHTPVSVSGRANGSMPSSGSSLKRKLDDSSTANTPTNKGRRVTNIDIGLASRYPSHHHSNTSPGDSSSATTSPSMPSLSFRQTVELSQKFQKYYKKYEELYWQLTEAETPPTDAQRDDLMKMHKKLEEMKREIKAGAGVKH